MKMTPFSKFKNNAVIIMGFPRSGTTLLSALLDYHPQLSVYPDKLHFPRVVYHEIAKRPLNNEEKLKILFAKSNLGGFQHDKYEIPEHPEEVRDYSDIDYNTFYKKLNERVSKAHNNKEIYLSVIESFYDVEQSDKGDKKAWVEKTSINYLIYPLLKKWFGNNLVCLHIVRNPYDNFVSYRNQFDEKISAIDTFCLEWAFSNSVAKMGKRAIKKYYTVSYEELVKDPEKVMRDVCKWIGIDYIPSVLEPTLNGKSWSGNSAYGAKFRSASATSIDKYKELLSKKDQKRIHKLLYGFDFLFRMKLLRRIMLFKLKWVSPKTYRFLLKMGKKIKRFSI